MGGGGVLIRVSSRAHGRKLPSFQKLTTSLRSLHGRPILSEYQHTDQDHLSDARRSKGKRGGLRVIYYYWTGGPEFWLFTLYDKDEMADLTPKQREALKERIKDELKARRKT